jgi:hypothetical protein
LHPYARNTPEAELLADLTRVARLLNSRSLTQAMYRQHGQFSPVTMFKRFGTWNAALKRAGLKASRNFNVPAKLVINDIRRVARRLKVTTLSGTQYVAHGRYCLPVIYRHFGNWQKAVEFAGLAPALCYRIEDDDLFRNLLRMWNYLNRQPRSTELLPPLSQYGISPYQRRFGGFNNALRAFVDWKNQNPGVLAAPISSPIFKHTTSRIVNHKLRYQVLLRDHFKCQACGRSPATDPAIVLEVDHKTPWSKGGETTVDNLQTLCDRCNGGKSNL